MKSSSNKYHMLKEFEYDESRLETYRRRSMDETGADTAPPEGADRVTPGGPNHEHHSSPPKSG
ncbi:hypothetical protein Ancab_025553 [Ancistrocladus abbreviatus]